MRYNYIPSSGDVHDPYFDEDMPSSIGAPRPRRLPDAGMNILPDYDIVAAATTLTMRTIVNMPDSYPNPMPTERY
jgi:hypothetical protein